VTVERLELISSLAVKRRGEVSNRMRCASAAGRPAA